MITRKDYLFGPRDKVEDGMNIHRKYYSQFVNKEVLTAVEYTFGAEELILAYAKDAHLNDIPVRKWDNLTAAYANLVDSDLLKRAGEVWSVSTGVCILKEAARQIAESSIH